METIIILFIISMMEIAYERNHTHELRYTQFPSMISPVTGLYRPTQMASSIFCGFIAQLVRASHRYREVMGLNPVEALNFSHLQAIA